MRFPFMLAVRLLKLLLVSNAHQFARRLLDDEGWCGHHPSGTAQRSLLLQHLRRPLSLSPQVNREQEVGVPVHSGRLTVFTEALHVVTAETFSPGH